MRKHRVVEYKSKYPTEELFRERVQKEFSNVRNLQMEYTSPRGHRWMFVWIATFERMQIKDIPTLPVLKFLESLKGMWGGWYNNELSNSITLAMPMIDDKLQRPLALAKMKSLIKKGLVDGCICGCRGDFELTKKGRAFILANTPGVALVKINGEVVGRIPYKGLKIGEVEFDEDFKERQRMSSDWH